MSRLTRQVRRSWQTVWDGWRGSRDARRLAELGLLGQSFKQGRAQAIERLRSRYEEYVATVSTAGMAVSWETACLLHALATVVRPREILDLGSGFSSCVLRTYAAAAHHDCQVTTVDDSADWLEKTRSYLAGAGLTTDRLFEWAQFARNLPVGRFDLVFHDLGSMQLRAECLPTVLRTLTPSGLLVLDDMHKAKYRRRAQRDVQRDGWQVLSARSQTLDALGRFSEIATRRQRAA